MLQDDSSSSRRSPVPRNDRGLRLMLLLSVLAAGGCMSADAYREDADREVYALIDARRRELFAEDEPFRIDPPVGSMRERLLNGGRLESELALVECLRIGAENNREYQTRKEALYSAALDVTLERWRLQTQGFTTLSGAVDGSSHEADNLEVGGDAGLQRLLGNGARIAGSIGSSLFRVVSSGDGWDGLSVLALSFTQPLMRGSGERIIKEPLTQAERNLVYAVRSFERFRRTFAVDLATEFYDLLRTSDQVGNERRNYENLVRIRERNEALALAGRVDDIDLGQARQNELRSENELLALTGDYARRLDDFKLFLGLPIESEFQLDSTVLADLEQDDPVIDQLDPDRAVRLALAERLDFKTTLDRLEDQVRRVYIDADALRPGLTLAANFDAETEEGKSLRFRSRNTRWSVGLDLDLPIERVIERNVYRQSLIDLQAQKREVERQADEIDTRLRDALRNARIARESYVIQRGAVALAERRVESATLRLEAGRAETRDLLEAQASLVSAQNAATSALIRFTLERLDLYRDLELLRVDENGMWMDMNLLDPLLEKS